MRKASRVRPSRTVLAELLEQAGDLRVILDVEREEQRAAEIGGHLGNPFLEAFVLVREGQFGTFTVHGLGDAVCNGTVAQQTGDQNTFAGEKAHGSNSE